jgi:aspartyl-tRNA(Asn)/glutamyl-tRNA(Gln) amidotransferase subunit B
MPGVLPVINRKAIEYVVMTGLALHADIPEATKFDRKNYPYPDLVKGYQISQYDLPLVKGGWLEIAVDGGAPHRIGMERVHLEEDTGKLTHAGDGSLVDYNRSGVPLMEMVSRPDLRTPSEARAYLQKLRAILRTLGVSGADMEKGQLRCDVNVSIRPTGQATFGTKVEIKNLNSFRSVQRALEYEIARQTGALNRGERIVQETRGWVEDRAVTVTQRTKEEAHDYRYFAEPDLPPLFLDRAYIEALRMRLPELPDTRRARYMTSFGLSAYDAEQLSTDLATAKKFEDTVSEGVDAKKAANLILNVERSLPPGSRSFEVPPHQRAQLIRLVEDGTLSGTSIPQVLARMYETGLEPRAVVDELGLRQVSDASALEAAVRSAIEANPAAVADYRAGKATAINFLKGQVMRATRGTANPAVAEDLLRRYLS